MATELVAGRYARALLDIGADRKKIDAFGKELRAFVEAYKASTELRVVLVNPGIPWPEREAVAVAILTRLRASESVRNFVRLIVERGRIGLIEAIADAYDTQADTRAGRVRGTIRSAHPVNPFQLRQLTDTLGTILHKEVLLETVVDDELIGGVRIEIGGLVFDDSIRGQLDRIREELTA